MHKTKKESKKAKIFSKDRVFFAAILSTLILVIGILLFTSFTFKLKGEEKVIVNYKEDYIESGALAKTFWRNKSDKIKIEGNVDTSKLGNYEIKYTYKTGPFTFTKTREVNVVDNQPPEISLKGENNSNSCPSNTYVEEGYEAYDNYDGDLTDKVERLEEDTKIIYKVTDSNGNTKIVERKTATKDEISPTITLNGGDTVTVTQGYNYQEKGYKVTDNCDNAIKVNVTGTVDTNKIGTYTLTYEAIDNSGNKTTAKRTVKVVEYVPPVNDTSPGVIFLTFDDGPSGTGSTAKILDTLKKYNVKATFFVTGNGPESLIKREYEEGHIVALHTNTHNYKTIYSSVDAYFEDLNKVHDRVERITGVDSRIIRFPGGSNNTVSNNYSKGIMSTLRKEVVNRGYTYFDWNVDASDAWSCTNKSVTDKKKCVYDNVTKHLSKKRRNIVLMHDVKSYTADALEDIIKYAKANNYSFEVITYDTKPVRFS